MEPSSGVSQGPMEDIGGQEMSEQNGLMLPVWHVRQISPLHHVCVLSMRGLKAWTRTDLQSATTRMMLRGGLAWGEVVTSGASGGQLLLADKSEDIPRALERARVSGGLVDLQTTLGVRGGSGGSDGRVAKLVCRAGVRNSICLYSTLFTCRRANTVDRSTSLCPLPH